MNIPRQLMCSSEDVKDLESLVKDLESLVARFQEENHKMQQAFIRLRKLVTGSGAHAVIDSILGKEASH